MWAGSCGSWCPVALGTLMCPQVLFFFRGLWCVVVVIFPCWGLLRQARGMMGLRLRPLWMLWRCVFFKEGLRGGAGRCLLGVEWLPGYCCCGPWSWWTSSPPALWQVPGNRCVYCSQIFYNTLPTKNNNRKGVWKYKEDLMKECIETCKFGAKILDKMWKYQ